MPRWESRRYDRRRSVPPSTDVQERVVPQAPFRHRPLLSFVPFVPGLRSRQRRVDALGSALGLWMWNGARSRRFRRYQHSRRRSQDLGRGSPGQVKRSGSRCKTSDGGSRRRTENPPALAVGELQILATLFGLLIPIHIFQSSLGGNPLSRFARVLLLNLQANVLVALVLAVAACYEAIEVIAMMK